VFKTNFFKSAFFNNYILKFQQKSVTMKLDQEIQIISQCYDLLSRTDDASKVRVLQWLSSKFRLGQSTLTIFSDAPAVGVAVEEETSEETVEQPSSNGANGAGGLESFSSFTEMFKYLKPKSDAEKALAAAVYLSSKKNVHEVSSAQVQKELKMIEERVSNITQAISALVKKKYVQQLGKDGDSQQARKKYKIMPEAAKAVTEMMKKRQ